MDKRTTARRVRALRALSVDPGASDSERESAKRFADKLEDKYGQAEAPSVYDGKPTSDGVHTMSTEEYLRWMYAQPTAHTMRREAEYTWLYVVKDSGDIVEEGYQYDPHDYDDNDY